MFTYPRDLKPGDVLPDGSIVRSVGRADFTNKITVSVTERDGSRGARRFDVIRELEIQRDLGDHHYEARIFTQYSDGYSIQARMTLADANAYAARINDLGRASALVFDSETGERA